MERVSLLTVPVLVFLLSVWQVEAFPSLSMGRFQPTAKKHFLIYFSFAHGPRGKFLIDPYMELIITPL